MEIFPFIQIILGKKTNLNIIWWRCEKKPKRKSNHPNHQGREKVFRAANNAFLL